MMDQNRIVSYLKSKILFADIYRWSVHGGKGWACILPGGAWWQGACMVLGVHCAEGHALCRGHAWCRRGMHVAGEHACCWGACMVPGGHAWWWGGLPGVGGIHGTWGVHGGRGHAWCWGCMVLGGMHCARGMHGVTGGMHVAGEHACCWGACMVPGGTCVVVGWLAWCGGHAWSRRWMKQKRTRRWRINWTVPNRHRPSCRLHWS